MVRDGPAEDAGLEGSEGTLELEGLELPTGGDIIVSIDGDPVETIDDVIAYLVANTRPRPGGNYERSTQRRDPRVDGQTGYQARSLVTAA